MEIFGLGVDIGGVLINREDYHEDETANGPILTTNSELPDARASLKLLAPLCRGRVFLVSKCGPLTEARMREWLDREQFFRTIGVDEANVRFCRNRADKVPLCAELGVTHVVDDRLEIINCFARVAVRRYLFDPVPTEVAASGGLPADVTVASSWPELLLAIRHSL